MRDNQNILEYRRTRFDIFIPLTIFSLMFSYIILVFMGGSPFSGPRLFNLFLILCFAIPYSLYKFYTAPEIMVSISPDGLLVPSAHKDRIPWNKVSGVELVPHSFFPTRAPFVRVRIEQSAKTGYPAPVLIHKPNLATSPKDVFDDIVAFWERYREKA